MKNLKSKLKRKEEKEYRSVIKDIKKKLKIIADSYPLIRYFKKDSLVLTVIQETFVRTGEIISIKEAAGLIEYGISRRLVFFIKKNKIDHKKLGF